MQPSDSQNSKNWTVWRCATSKLCPNCPQFHVNVQQLTRIKPQPMQRCKWLPPMAKRAEKMFPYHTYSPKVMQNAFTTSTFSPPLKKIVPNGRKTALKSSNSTHLRSQIDPLSAFEVPSESFKACPSPQLKLEGPFLPEIAALLARARVLQPCIEMTPKRAAIERTNCFQQFLKSREPLKTRSPIKAAITTNCSTSAVNRFHADCVVALAITNRPTETKSEIGVISINWP